MKLYDNVWGGKDFEESLKWWSIKLKRLVLRYQLSLGVYQNSVIHRYLHDKSRCHNRCDEPG